MSDELRDSGGQPKVAGKHHVHQERSVHIFAACRCVKLWGGVRCWKGLGGRGAPSRCCPAEAVPLSHPDTNCSISNVYFLSFLSFHTFLCLNSLWFSEHGRIFWGFCKISSLLRTPPLSACACLALCLVVQTNMINEAIGVSRMSCDQRAFDVWHF